MGRGPFTRSKRHRNAARQWAMLAALTSVLLYGITQVSTVQSHPLADLSPNLVDSYPAHNADKVVPPTSLTLTFSEPVALGQGAISLDCAITANITLAVSGGPVTFSLSPNKAIAANNDCQLTVKSELVTDLDSTDPPDHMVADSRVVFHTALPTAEDLVINEVDAVAGDAAHEFVELYDGGAGNTALDGLRIVFYNGQADTVYGSASLNGYTTGTDGYFLLSSNPATADLLLANGFLLDGPAAIALYKVPGATFPNGSPVTLNGLVDAVVYDSGQSDDPGLLPLLDANEPQINESANGQAIAQSNQRCPDGLGGQRRTSTYRVSSPTPAAANDCVLDAHPVLVATSPQASASVDPNSLEIKLSFDEPVTLGADALSLHCTQSGEHALSLSGGPTNFSAIPLDAPAYGESCTVYIVSRSIHDLDAIDPPDGLISDYMWSFETLSRVAGHMLINEVDSDTPGSDTTEFVELYDGGEGNTSLDGLLLVLYNGSTGKSYRTIELAGFQTDSAGYFVIGNSAVSGKDLTIPDATLQNGPDAVALYAAESDDFPNGTSIAVSGLLDALVYGPTGSDAQALTSLLETGQAMANEYSRGMGDLHAIQRCPNGSGAQRQTSTFRPNLPTPKTTNVCTADDAPWVLTTFPIEGSQEVAQDTSLIVGFSESVVVKPGWVQLNCTLSGTHVLQISGGPDTYQLSPVAPFFASEQCTATVQADLVNDADADDPPDLMGFDFAWSFSTAEPAANFVLINEADTNTTGVDTAEFIELYDGGRGETSLDGLTVVLYNGSSGTSYAAIGLSGRETNAEGYFVIGNAAVNGVDLVISSGAIQNGTDAIAIYAAAPSAFPNNTPVTTDGLIDALVYGSESNATLQVLLNTGQSLVNENGTASAETHSMQRCPNGSGGPRNTDTIRLGEPTPGQISACPVDVAPQLIATFPAAAETGVATNAALQVTFSEPVQLGAAAITLECDDSGSHALLISGGPVDFTLTPANPFLPNEACHAAIYHSEVTDLDEVDPPDTMSADVAWTFETAVDPGNSILINEFDADTPGTDSAEFIELFDGGGGNQNLIGYVLVLFNGQSDVTYRTIDLSGTQTDANGYLVLGGPDIPESAVPMPVGALQNGPDAIALYRADPQQFPNGSPLTVNNLVDAVVYGTADSDDAELLALLLPAQPQVDESSRGQSSADSNQRCAASLVARETAGFAQRGPTPGAANDCLTDEAPKVLTTLPIDGATGVAATSALAIGFSEPVTSDADWLQIVCGTSGPQDTTIQGGPTTFTVIPTMRLPDGEQCVATILANKIHDTDTNDPPDGMTAEYVWSFTVEAAACAAESTPIHAIQGTGSFSPYQSQTVTTMGVVTADFREGLGAIFIQSPDGMIDVNPATSEGMMVISANEQWAIEMGDRVIVSGRVAEIQQRTALIEAELIAICESGVAVSSRVIDVVPAEQSGWEAMENMLVAAESAAITDISRLVPADELSLILGSRPSYPTELLEPGAAVQAEINENLARMFTLDDGRMGTGSQGILLKPDHPVRTGDLVSAILGVVDGYEGGRRIHSIVPPDVVATNPRAPVPQVAPGAVRIAAVDLGVYANGNGVGGGFATPGGAQSQAEYLRQRAKVVAMIHALSADIVAINGLENDGYGPGSATQDLLEALNATNPGQPYQLASAPVAGSESYHYQSAIFLRTNKVLIVGAEAPDISDGGLSQPQAVWLQEQTTGEAFSIVLVHLDPRNGCPGTGADADQFDGQACHNQSRTTTAVAIGQWLAAGSDKGRALILGNWNTFGQEDPLQAMGNLGFSDLTPEPPDSYSITINRHIGAMHRLVAGEEIVPLVDAVKFWHINADESPAYDYRLSNPAGFYAENPVRAAEADPLIIDLNIGKLQAQFSSNTPVFIGETMHFLNETSGTGALSFSWNFGDGTPPVDERHPSHIYKRIGTYEVVLTASDFNGSAVFRRYVDVLPRRMYLPVGAGGK